MNNAIFNIERPVNERVHSFAPGTRERKDLNAELDRLGAEVQDIPLIIVSTEKTDEDKKRGIALGAAGYVVKPFRKEDLMALVTRAVKMS